MVANCSAKNATLALCDLPFLPSGEHDVRVSNDNSSFTSGGVTLSAARVPGVVAVRMHPLQRGSAHIGDSSVIADERVALVLDGPASPFSFRCGAL